MQMKVLPPGYCLETGVEERLAAGGESASVGHGQAEIFVGIDWGVVDADFVVEMGAGAASAIADVSDGVAAVDLLACSDREIGQVAVAGGDAVAVIENNGAAVAAHEVGEFDDAVGGRDHRLAHGSGNIHAGVECTFAVEGINALAE